MPTRIPKSAPDNADLYRVDPLIYIRRLYISFVQGLFRARPQGCTHWDIDPQTTEIVVTAEMPVKAETLGDRPGITFTRAPIGFFHLGFDDMLSYDFRTGQKVKSVLLPGTMVINCCSRNDLESESFAFFVAEHLWLLRDILMRRGFYDVGRNLQVGSPSKAGDLVQADQGDVWFATSVTSPYHFFRTSAFTPLDGTILQEIQLRLSVLSPSFITTGYPMAPNVDMPYQVDTRRPEAYAPGAEGNIRRNSNLGGLPVVPHPLNPAQQVVIRPVRADQPGLRPASMGGRAIPISRSSVEESAQATAFTTLVKV